MSGSEGQWAAFSSRNERVAQQGELGGGLDVMPECSARANWAELASQSERLLDANDPLFRLCSPSHGAAGLRLVAGAA